MYQIRTRQLRIVADEIIVEAREKRDGGDGAKKRRGYRLNMFLLVALLVAAMIWFEIHLKNYFAETALVGGTLTLFALWKLIQSWTLWGFSDDAKVAGARILGTLAATELLCLGLFVVVMLFVTTSSVYVTLDGAPRGEDDFEVDVFSRNTGNGSLQPFLPGLALSSNHKTIGQPFLLSFAGRDLVFHIVKPHGYRTVTRTLRPWSSIHLSVPGRAFTKRELHVVTVVPGVSLIDHLPKLGDEAQDRWFVRIESPGQHSVRKDDVRFQRMIIGAPAEDLQWADVKPLSRDSMSDYLVGQDVSDPEIRQGYFAHWESDPILIPTGIFRSGDRVTITIGRIDARSDQRPLTSTFVIDRSPQSVHFF